MIRSSHVPVKKLEFSHKKKSYFFGKSIRRENFKFLTCNTGLHVRLVHGLVLLLPDRCRCHLIDTESGSSKRARGGRLVGVGGGVGMEGGANRLDVTWNHLDFKVSLFVSFNVAWLSTSGSVVVTSSILTATSGPSPAFVERTC